MLHNPTGGTAASSVLFDIRPGCILGKDRANQGEHNVFICALCKGGGYTQSAIWYHPAPTGSLSAQVDIEIIKNIFFLAPTAFRYVLTAVC